MLQAAHFEGLVDLQHFRSREPGDWRRLYLALQYLEQRQQRELLSWEYQRSLALLQRCAPEHLTQVAEGCDAIYGGLEDLLQPWAADERARLRTSTIERMRQDWTDIYGDPDDPAVQAKIDATVRFLTE